MVANQTQRGVPRDPDSGRWKPVYGVEDVFNAVSIGEPMSAAEVADAVGCSRSLAHDLLQELADEGRIRKKTHNPRRVTWYRPEGTQ